MSDSYPSLFGTQAPMFICEDVQVDLDYWHTIKDEAEKIEILHESVITRAREWDDLGKHWIFAGQIYLYKYSTAGDAVDKYTELLNFKRYLVTLYRRRDGEPFQDAVGNIIPFRFNKLGLKYVPFPEYPDILELEFISQDPVIITQSMTVESL